MFHQQQSLKNLLANGMPREAIEEVRYITHVPVLLVAIEGEPGVIACIPEDHFSCTDDSIQIRFDISPDLELEVGQSVCLDVRFELTPMHL